MTDNLQTSVSIELSAEDIEKIRLQNISLAIEILLSQFPIDPSDPNLVETPLRVAQAYLETWLSGYDVDFHSLLTVFPNRVRDDLVIVKDIQFYSLCAHHLAPFFGTAHIAYVPGEHVLGLSKFARVVQALAHRLQLQEELGSQIADTLVWGLQPKGVMVVLKNVEHTCMTSRGVKAHGAVTTTSSIRGIFETDSSLRSEALHLITS
ncbi:MAG: GTP cyclohydrolase I [Candidatus Competibacteraceae bacterium]|nr:GTP cyclohydrolase I [Candidatus Competibacteraceae bacterium]